MCSQQGTEKSKVDLYLMLSGYDMHILPENEPFGSPAFQRLVRIKAEKDYGITNLNSCGP